MNAILMQLTLAAGLAAAGAAAAADITLYEDEGYRGRAIQSNASMANLAAANFNDRASSAVIRDGVWQLCTRPYFGGRCVTLGTGSYPNLGAMDLDDAISSARELWDRNAGVGGGGAAQRPSVVLYEGYRLNGVSILANRIVPNLDGTGFNDRARSMVVSDGAWELCVDADFRGNCHVFEPGRYDDLGFLSGSVSSLRPAGGRPAGRGRGGDWGAGDWGAGNRVVLYDGANLSGRRLVVDGYFANLDGTGFNDRASSMRVERGYWIFCSDAVFQGECRTFGPGDYPQLPHALRDRISSGRRIADDYPYRGNPNWGGPR